MPDKNTKPAPRKEYVLKADNHIHRGKPLKKGDTIDLTEAQAVRMKAAGVI